MQNKTPTDGLPFISQKIRQTSGIIWAIAPLIRPRGIRDKLLRPITILVTKNLDDPIILDKLLLYLTGEDAEYAELKLGRIITFKYYTHYYRNIITEFHYEGERANP